MNTFTKDRWVVVKVLYTELQTQEQAILKLRQILDSYFSLKKPSVTHLSRVLVFLLCKSHPSRADLFNKAWAPKASAERPHQYNWFSVPPSAPQSKIFNELVTMITPARDRVCPPLLLFSGIWRLYHFCARGTFLSQLLSASLFFPFMMRTKKPGESNHLSFWVWIRPYNYVSPIRNEFPWQPSSLMPPLTQQVVRTSHTEFLMILPGFCTSPLLQASNTPALCLSCILKKIAWHFSDSNH